MNKQINSGTFNQLKQLMEKIYNLIPPIVCSKGCSDCCGVTRWTYAEWLLITDYLRQHGMKERFAKSVFEKCPYLEGNKCKIYEVRPLICRLFGVVDHELLKCPYVRAEKYLTAEMASKMMEAIARISMDLERFGEIGEDTVRFVEKLKEVRA